VGDNLFAGNVYVARVKCGSKETSRLFQTIQAPGMRIEGQAESFELLPVPTRADAGHDPVAAKERSQLEELPESQRRMLDADVDDAGAENQALRERSRDGQPYEWLRATGCLTSGPAPAEKEVVLRKHPVQADLLVTANLLTQRIQGLPEACCVDFDYARSSIDTSIDCDEVVEFKSTTRSRSSRSYREVTGPLSS
jgi:hypothetical protein